MALIACKECGREISDKAVTCPGCGCPTMANAGNELRPVFLEEAIKSGPPEEMRDKYEGYGRKQLFNIAFDTEHRDANTRAEAIHIYQLVTNFFPNTNEAFKAQKNIEKMLIAGQNSPSTPKKDKKETSLLFTIVSTLLVVLVVTLGFMFFTGSTQTAGSYHYKGNIDRFIQDNELRANKIVLITRFTIFTTGVWFILLIKGMFRRS